jgi:hypothetical protein
VWGNAVCSGALGRVAERLAAHAAATVAGGTTLPQSPLDEAALAQLDDAFDRFCNRSANHAAVIRALDGHREDWTYVDLRSLVTNDQHVAREVALCVRVDGRSFPEVASDASLTLERRGLMLEEVEEPLRTGLLGARRGELVGPLSHGDAYRLIEVLDRRAPALDQPEVMDRARRAAIGRAVEREVTERVSWHERP